jgi:hypothetical protein
MNTWLPLLEKTRLSISPPDRDTTTKRPIPDKPCAKCHQAPRHDRSYCKECRMALNRYYWPRRAAKMKGIKL